MTPLKQRRRWGLDPGADQRSGTPRRSLVVALVLASATLMVLDQGDGGSPVDPARAVVGEVLGPAETGAATVATGDLPCAAYPSSPPPRPWPSS